jgi:hypothetical protein
MKKWANEPNRDFLKEDAQMAKKKKKKKTPELTTRVPTVPI